MTIDPLERLIRSGWVVFAALVLAAAALAGAGYTHWREQATTHCIVSWANSFQDRTSALTVPSKARSDASSRVLLALGTVTAILTSTSASGQPTTEVRARYVKAIADLDVAERAFKAADDAYTAAFRANPAAPVAAKLSCT